MLSNLVGQKGQRLCVHSKAQKQYIDIDVNRHQQSSKVLFHHCYKNFLFGYIKYLLQFLDNSYQDTNEIRHDESW